MLADLVILSELSNCNARQLIQWSSIKCTCSQRKERYGCLINQALIKLKFAQILTALADGRGILFIW